MHACMRAAGAQSQVLCRTADTKPIKAKVWSTVDGFVPENCEGLFEWHPCRLRVTRASRSERTLDRLRITYMLRCRDCD
eukprot:COSAG01_NODE_4862_length_4677_cov_3.891219_2_plen_79_part_00